MPELPPEPTEDATSLPLSGLSTIAVYGAARRLLGLGMARSAGDVAMATSVGRGKNYFH
jgi:hypothetical protein